MTTHVDRLAETHVAVLHTQMITAEKGPRGAQRFTCECGYRVYASDRQWAWKLFDHLASHGEVSFAMPIKKEPEPQPAQPQLRRVK